MNESTVSQLIQNYFNNPQPDKVQSFFAYVLDSHILDIKTQQGPMASAIVCLSDLAPEYKQLIANAKSVIAKMEADDRPGCNDILIVRWFILHDREAVKSIIERCKRKDAVGASAMWMLNSVAGNDHDLRSLIVELTND